MIIMLFQHWEECLEKLGGEQDVYRGESILAREVFVLNSEHQFV